MLQLQIADSKAFPETPRAREISSAKIGCSAHPAAVDRRSAPARLAAAMLFGWLRFVMPYRRISASRLLSPAGRPLRLLSPAARLAAAIAPRRRGKSARRQFSPLGRNGLSDNIWFCNPVACHAQSTFHSRMPDVVCSLPQVWTVRTICRHRPY